MKEKQVTVKITCDITEMNRRLKKIKAEIRAFNKYVAKRDWIKIEEQ